MRRAIMLASTVVLILAACGGGDPSDADLRSALVDSGADPVIVRCIVGELSDEWTAADKDAILDLDTDHEWSVDKARFAEVYEDCGGAEGQG